MNKLFLSLIIIPVLFGVGCSQELKTSSKNSESFDTSFKRKQECTKYKDQAEKQVNSDHSLLFGADGYLEEFFYSPKVNSCVYYFIFTSGATGRIMEGHYLFDILSNKYVEGTGLIDSTDEDYWETMTTFTKKIDEYR